mgnify:FL=1
MGITVFKAKYCMGPKSVTPLSFPLLSQVNLSLLSKTLGLSDSLQVFYTFFTPLLYDSDVPIMVQNKA